MGLISGRYAKIMVASSPIDYMGHWEIRIEHDDMDASYFGNVWKRNMVGMQGWSGSMEGYFNTSTDPATLENVIMDYSFEATKVQDIKFYLTASSLFLMPLFSSVGILVSTDSTSNTNAGAYLTNMRVTADKNAVTTIGYDIRGVGPLGLFASTV